MKRPEDVAITARVTAITHDRIATPKTQVSSLEPFRLHALAATMPTTKITIELEIPETSLRLIAADPALLTATIIQALDNLY